MWKRFVRAIRALFGKAVTAIEDPKLILEQNIRDLNDQVPKMNENIATVKASVMLLEKEVRKYEDEQADLVSKMRAAINGSRDDIAGQYAMRLETCKRNLQQTQGQLATAKAAYEKSLEVKKAFMKEKDRKIAEAKEALRAHERAKWQSKIADTLQSFEVGGMDQTHNDMLQRINEQTAMNEAKMEMALDSVDTSGMKLEEEAEKLRAAELVKQFKMEMGMDSKVEKPIQDSGGPLDNRDKTV
jgi:phage shock protein A